MNAPAELVAGVVIEPAGPRDVDALLGVARESFTTPWTRKMFEAELNGNPFARILAARRRGEVLGYLCFWLVFEELRLMDLAVAPSARRRGIGRALVAQALHFGRERGASRAVLEARASNEAAHLLYAEFGFRRVALRASYYSEPTEDAILMELTPLGDLRTNG
jgi:ribosomal-protein-alanine N-acetyltransferase